MTQDDPIITITDIRLAGHCPGGAKTWFAEHGFSFREFLRDGGWPASRLLAVRDNGLIREIVRRKMERERE